MTDSAPGCTKLTLELYPCDLLFVHRDAERETRQARVNEIHNAVKSVQKARVIVPVVCVVPVRMQEAWFLFDEYALRSAASNPNGREPLYLPPLSEIEHLRDPKETLYSLLRDATGLSRNRLHRAPIKDHARRVAELIDDFSPLRTLSAFAAFEADLTEVLEAQGWRALT